MQVKMQKIFQFEDKVGHNTLLACFGMLKHDTTKENSAMKAEIAETILFLINTGHINGVDTTKIINHAGHGGDTVFSSATKFLPTMSIFLQTCSRQV